MHDELVLEAPTDEAEAIAAEVARLMNDAAQLIVELKVDTGIGQNWDEAH